MTKKSKPVQNLVEVEEYEPQQDSSIFVLIEWDGYKAPATFYNRLHAYGLYSRRARYMKPDQIAESGESLYEWRSNRPGEKKSRNNRGIILQEGIIQCNSASLAAEIKQVAVSLKAKNVIVGNFIVSSFVLPQKDLDVFTALEKKTAKRGAKARVEAGRYVVTCFDEAKTFEIESETLPAHCPNCGSARTDVRLGKQVAFSWDAFPEFDITDSHDCMDIVSFWMRTRFSNASAGKFEVPMMYEDKKHPFPAQDTGILMDAPDMIKNLWNSMNIDGTFSEQLVNDIKNDAKATLQLLDDLFCASLKNKASRKLERIKVWGRYLQTEGDNLYDPNPPIAFDIVDLVQIDDARPEEHKVDWFKYM